MSKEIGPCWICKHPSVPQTVVVRVASGVGEVTFDCPGCNCRYTSRSLQQGQFGALDEEQRSTLIASIQAFNKGALQIPMPLLEEWQIRQAIPGWKPYKR